MWSASRHSCLTSGERSSSTHKERGTMGTREKYLACDEIRATTPPTSSSCCSDYNDYGIPVQSYNMKRYITDCTETRNKSRASGLCLLSAVLPVPPVLITAGACSQTGSANTSPRCANAIIFSQSVLCAFISPVSMRVRVIEKSDY